MAADIVRTGGCLCGAVRYEVRGEPFQSGLCHCTTCRKLTGSSFSASANWRPNQFRMTGELGTYERRSFCPSCGSRLLYLYDDGVEIFLGSLDLAPKRHQADGRGLDDPSRALASSCSQGHPIQ
jgi:hypothetical protein